MTSSPDNCFLGIEIGGTKLQAGVGTGDGRMIESARAAVPRGATGAAIQDIILKLSRKLIQTHPVQGIGVGFGGPVDVRTGTITCSHQVEGWEGFSLRDWLQDEIGRPATVENDSNTAALAEARLGAGAGLDPVFYSNLGSGVGGGLICNGRIYHGRPPGESEMGHLRLSPGGPIVESVCSGWALDRRLRRMGTEDPDSLLARLLRDVTTGEARVLPEALAAGDPRARQALAETVEAFAFGLSHVVHLMHPQIIVIGGGLSHLGELLLVPLREQLESNTMAVFRPPPVIRAAALGDNVVPIGAVLLAAGAAERER